MTNSPKPDQPPQIIIEFGYKGQTSIENYISWPPSTNSFWTAGVGTQNNRLLHSGNVNWRSSMASTSTQGQPPCPIPSNPSHQRSQHLGIQGCWREKGLTARGRLCHACRLCRPTVHYPAHQRPGTAQEQLHITGSIWWPSGGLAHSSATHTQPEIISRPRPALPLPPAQWVHKHHHHSE